jgi:hypothetical protein
LQIEDQFKMSSGKEIFMSIFNNTPSEWSVATWSCLLVPLAALLATVVNYFRWHYVGDRIPGPPVDTFLKGNYPEYRRKAGSNRNVSAFYEWLHEKYGTVARYWLGPSDLWVSVSDPKLAKEALQNATERPPVMKKLLQFLGEENQTFKKAEFARCVGKFLLPRSDRLITLRASVDCALSNRGPHHRDCFSGTLPRSCLP